MPDCQPQPSSDENGALSELRILDLSSGIAGAYCTKLLADFGADVTKVEPPAGGDPLRDWGPYPDDAPDSERGLLFWYLNANKRGITLDIAGEAGRNLLGKLLSSHHVVVESYSSAWARGVGITYDSFAGERPDLIWLSITPFGQSGPYADYKATDLIMQAASGWLFDGGVPEREPLKTGGFITHYIIGSYGAVAVLAAWAYRQMSGHGQHIDLSGMEAVQSTTGYAALGYSVTGQTRGRSGQGFPFAIVPCKDGYVGVNILTASHWELLCAFMGRPDLTEDPRFATPAARRENAGELTAIVTEWASEHTREEIFRAQEWRVPLNLVPTVAEILAFPQHAAREFFVERDLPGVGVIRQPGAPFKMSASPWRLRRGAPKLGEHNHEVYCKELGLSASDLVQLRRHRVI